ncbi:MAG: YicC family protein [Gammaproteobacteria bacterium]|nr:YicC family protein [Gammaproteobacteria bacterium]
MTKSMTAFARTSDTQDFGSLVWELRSVNHRYLDISTRIPEDLRAIEIAAREKVATVLKRGKVECTLRFKSGVNHSAEISVNEPLARALVTACQIVNKQLHQPSQMNLMDVLRWPGVVEMQEQDLAPVNQAALSLLDAALNELVENRQREGERLKDMVLQRKEAMEEIVRKEQARRPEILKAYREKMLARLEELNASPDTDRFEQELAYLAQKMDVDEELDRLNSHFKELSDVFNRDEAIGRRLDFIMQELNREANTLGSKSVDMQSTQASVDLKVLIEQMREQIQNIE